MVEAEIANVVTFLWFVSLYMQCVIHYIGPRLHAVCSDVTLCEVQLIHETESTAGAYASVETPILHDYYVQMQYLYLMAKEWEMIAKIHLDSKVSCSSGLQLFSQSCSYQYLSL